MQLEGKIKNVVYHNDDNGYTVFRLQDIERDELVTVIGYTDVHAGEKVTVRGNWSHHAKYGNQFKMSDIIINSRPNDTDGLDIYLSSGILKGVGPAIAERIIAKFGDKTLDILDNHPDRLIEIDGIGQTKLDKMLGSWNTDKFMRQVRIDLLNLGISPAYVKRIYNVYKGNSVEIINKNPYRLCFDVKGIGFKVADGIAMKMGVPKDSPFRVEAGIDYILNDVIKGQGHVCIPLDDLYSTFSDNLGVEHRELFDNVLANMMDDGKVVVDKYNNVEYYYSHRMFFHERNIVERLYDIEHGDSYLDIGERNDQHALLQYIVDSIGNSLNIEYAPEQEQAIKSALNNKITIITGGPGVGKTTVINGVIHALVEHDVNFGLCAPTGKAAKQMEIVTKHKAQTIHRLLEVDYNGVFQKNRDKPLSLDYIVVDEMSMVDLVLFSHLLDAVPNHAHLLLVGDIDQLPSVGQGVVLSDLIKCNQFSVVYLKHIYRQALNSLIVKNAHKINNGEFPILVSKPISEYKSGGMYYYDFNNIDEIIDFVEVLTRKSKDINRIQILTPMKKGFVGTYELNLKLQKRLNKNAHDISGDGIERGIDKYRVGDKVIQTKNNYNKMVFNGDMGIVCKIDKSNYHLHVDFGNRVIVFTKEDMNHIMLAYALTVHKSQGSEFDIVIMFAMKNHYIMMKRNILYTGITRGKKLVILIGNKGMIGMGVKNDSVAQRYSLLRYKLKLMNKVG